ncbi:DUF3794 domain-containing protein [Haloimpatiens sp. FM7330]|uniref:DUF3794 domain-containing protein n=1 Tax=Haloimpatiens sp. FM7330 TaxID=3298610 RepID=UPI003641AEFA
MNNDFIDIKGITPCYKFPKIPPCYPCKELCEEDRLCIPCQKPDMECLLDVSVHLSVSCFKVINTPIGKKLFIKGIKNIRILYVADEPSQSVHAAHFNVPFCMFILLKNIPCKVIDIYTAIEDIQVNPINERCFSISILIFACPVFKRKYHDCKSYEKNCNNANYRCSDYDKKKSYLDFDTNEQFKENNDSKNHLHKINTSYDSNDEFDFDIDFNELSNNDENS